MPSFPHAKKARNYDLWLVTALSALFRALVPPPATVPTGTPVSLQHIVRASYW